MLNVIVGGLAQGLIYGLLGVGLVLLYRGTKVLNFAHGEIGLFATFVGFTLAVTLSLPVWIAILGALFVGAALAVVMERTIIRPLGPENMLGKAIATLGVFLILSTLTKWIWFPDPTSMPGLFPDTNFEVFGAHVSWTSVGVLGIALVTLGALVSFFKWHPLGIVIRANADNPTGFRLIGLSPGLATSATWAVSGALAALAGMLLAPTAFLSVNLMTPPLIKGMAAAVVGGFSSLGGAVMGGLLIGVSENLLAYWVDPSWKTPFAFLVLFLILMIRPTGLVPDRVVSRV